jgi:predicted NBD/HSP70 family sugar kinase
MAAHEVIEIGNVGVIGYGGTNARSAINYATGELGSFTSELTPDDKDGFMSWLAQKTLEMYTGSGIHNIFVGFPGPVHDRGSYTEIGPMVNIPFLRDSTMVLEKELAAYEDPLLGRILENGDLIMQGGNDGHLHAGAAAHFYGQKMSQEGLDYYSSVGGLIVGTGIGGDVVDRMSGHFYRRTDENVLRPIFRHRLGLREWGHLRAGSKSNFEDDYEARYSGPVLNDTHDFGLSAMEAGDKPDQPIWQHAGNGYADLIGDVAETDNPDLLVISGGFGSREFRNYSGHLRHRVAQMIASGNMNLRMALEATTVKGADPNIADTYELYGAPVLFAARRAAA